GTTRSSRPFRFLVELPFARVDDGCPMAVSVAHAAPGARERAWGAGRVAGTAAAVAGALVLASLATRALVERYPVGEAPLPVLLALKLFDVNTEQNLPTWFSSSLLLACALLACVVAGLLRAARRRRTWSWVLFAAA